jgi:hypothetical protein
VALWAVRLGLVSLDAEDEDVGEAQG